MVQYFFRHEVAARMSDFAYAARTDPEQAQIGEHDRNPEGYFWISTHDC
jgi:hypothetical protein